MFIYISYEIRMPMDCFSLIRTELIGRRSEKSPVIFVTAVDEMISVPESDTGCHCVLFLDTWLNWIRIYPALNGSADWALDC